MSNIKDLISAIGQTIIENKEYLTELDQAIGDGDHGINMARGFEVVSTKLQAIPEDADVSTVLKQVGMGLISSVGGASGPLYGTAFMRASTACKDKEIDLLVARDMLEAAIKGIQDRGKAVAGEKTMLDTLIPAVDALNEAIEQNKSAQVALEEMVKAARIGAENTKTIIATKGRASYLGERSLGHQDPGATSSLLMLEDVVKYLVGSGKL